MRNALRRGGPRRSLAALVLASCGGDSDGTPETKAEAGGRVLGRLGGAAGAVPGLEHGGNRAERLATIDDIREQVNLKDSAVQTPELSDKAAYRVLDTTCRKAFAAGFRLYKLYARAASFAPFAE